VVRIAHGFPVNRLRECREYMNMTETSSANTFAKLVGAVFLLVGVLGFVPGITSNLGDITFATHDSGAELLGIFSVNILHNIVHLAFGVLGLMAARRGLGRTYLLAGGATYLVVWLYGLVVDFSSGANFIALNTADNWLHLVLGAGMLALGLITGRQPARRRTATA
jgi:preprotein translocase subunit Sss1